MGDHVQPAPADLTGASPALQTAVPSRSEMVKVADFLQDNCRIGKVAARYEKYRRYVTLERAAMFTSLVTLYTPLFQTTWIHFKRFMEQFNVPHGTHPWVYATRIYISAWMHDLYVSNRDAVKKLTPVAFAQHFITERAYFSYEYDPFLVRLNASIRPTHIQGLPEDTLYIPLIAEDIDWTNETNPFAINNFELDFDLLTGLIQVMKDRKTWKMQPLVSDTIGRPGWLFDWHDNHNVCAWFPMDGNYNMEDVAIAYIVGVACTPKLGIRDTDDWQNFENNEVPLNFNIDAAQRAAARRFYGRYEVRTYSQRVTSVTAAADQEGPQKKKTRGATKATTGKSIVTQPATSEPSGTSEEDLGVQIAIPQFQIIDWCYYHRVVENMETHTRTGALRMLVFN